MKIGIISDTHRDLIRTRAAVAAFQQAGVQAVFHCGDIGSMEVLAELAVLSPVHAVLGNVDLYSAEWKYFPPNIGVEMHGRFGEIMFQDQFVALLHGDDVHRLHRSISNEKYDLVLSGHSHVFHDFTEKRTRCINPGSAGRGMPNSCAVLDLISGRITRITLP